jgi:chemotaxis receptor (MCP) glutamine deamidase CheD
MIATRGDTEMERLVLREKLTTVKNMSAELKALKVRYGELVGEDVLGVEGRTMGFGTVEETVSLRKRK